MALKSINFAHLKNTLALLCVMASCRTVDDRLELDSLSTGDSTSDLWEEETVAGYSEDVSLAEQELLFVEE